MSTEPTTPAGPSAPTATHHVGIGARLRNYFLAGVLVVAPIAITLYVTMLVVRAFDGWLTPLIPVQYRPETYLQLPIGIPGLGLIMALVGLTFIGWITAGVLGRLVVRLGEAIVTRMPVVRGIYSASKQIVETVFKNKSAAFRQVVLVEFPMAGIWSVGFITGTTDGEVGANLPGDMVNVFVPMTPNITSGFLLYMPRDRTRELSMSVEEGIKMVVSIGIISPSERAPDATARRSAAAD